MKIRVTARYKVWGVDDLDDETNLLHDALVAAEKVHPETTDSSVRATLASALVEISIVVRSASWEDAEHTGDKFIREAITAVGGEIVDPDARHASDHISGLEAAIQSTELIPA